jgi:hypothetical protein
MIKSCTILFLLTLCFFRIFAQPAVIQVNVKDIPLNVVLLQLRNKYNYQFSYNENQLSKYKITVSKIFESKQEAIEYLLKDIPFYLKKVDDVYVIIPDKKKKKEIQREEQIQITGQIVEAGSFEPLPFSYILINNNPLIADITGNFNFTTSTADSSFHLRISHLGYFIYDTVINAGKFTQYKLIPSSIKLPEVTVKKSEIEKATMVGEEIGKIMINNNISQFLPGQGDNSVFHQIRLMPGIQAANEQSSDILIWGSYEGQSLITFDEFTLFGLKNYNENISVVNPFLVKTIEIQKGGLDSKYGNRVGGVVNIIGKNGNIAKPVFSFNINPTTLNGMAEIPIHHKSSLLLAYRQTYYNLYNSGDFDIFAPTHKVVKNQEGVVEGQNPNIDLSVYPDNYRFRDGNIKFSRNFNNGGQFYLSMYGGGDYFHLAVNTNLTRKINDLPTGEESTSLSVSLLDKEKNQQYGLSAFYNQKWKDNWSSKFILSHSNFSRKYSDETNSTNSSTSEVYRKETSSTDNTAVENSFRNENIVYFNGGHQLELGGGFYNNSAKIDYSSTSVTTTTENSSNFNNSRLYAFANDNLPLGKHFILKAGLRLNVLTNNAKSYLEPRVNATYKISESLKVNAAWGRFHQFISKIANVDRDQNYTYLWSVSNNEIPVVDATHWVGEINYSHNSLTINIDGYYKQTHNITERVFEQRTQYQVQSSNYYLYFGNAKAYGLDFFVKKDFGKHSLWVTYTLSKALESLAPTGEPLPGYSLAPNHQLHELKAAGLLNIGRFYFSSDYVYGSGMEILRKIFGDSSGNLSYNRVDVALIYKLRPKKFSAEVGASVMNLLDTQNLKYNNLRNIELNQELGDIRIYSDAARFTPSIFLKVVF